MEPTKLVEALAVTYAAVGQEMTDAGLEIVANDLSAYPLDDVLHALSRSRKELRRIALADILDRLPNQHPGVEEAWALVSPSLQNEALTLVWTDPMRIAFGLAVALSDDRVAARMAFKESYLREIAIARESSEPPVWSVSPGRDAGARASVIEQAVKMGRLPESSLLQLPPPYTGSAFPVKMKSFE